MQVDRRMHACWQAGRQAGRHTHSLICPYKHAFTRAHANAQLTYAIETKVETQRRLAQHVARDTADAIVLQLNVISGAALTLVCDLHALGQHMHFWLSHFQVYGLVQRSTKPQKTGARWGALAQTQHNRRFFLYWWVRWVGRGRALAH